MQACEIRMTTIADGQTTQTVRRGEMHVERNVVRLHYLENGARVQLTLDGKTARLERTGDYQLMLNLQSGEEKKGVIGIGGSNGEISVFTYKIEYTAGKGSVLAILLYDLIIGGEKQEMHLRLHAKSI